MIKVYYLKVRKIGDTDVVDGGEYIHSAVLETTEEPNVRKLVMDTAPEEDTGLSGVAVATREATALEQSALKSLPPLGTPRNLISEFDNLVLRVEQLERKLKGVKHEVGT